MKYLAKQILEQAGIEADVLGTTAVNIGGLNVSKPDHIINIAGEGNSVNVVVGDSDPVTVEMPVIEEGTKRDPEMRAALQARVPVKEEAAPEAEAAAEDTPE